MKKSFIGICLLVSLFFGCRSISKEQAFRQFVEDPQNRITQLAVTSDVRITSRYLPGVYRRLIQPETSITDSGHIYFDVKIDLKFLEKLPKEKAEYLIFSIQNDFSLKLGNGHELIPAICQKVENGIQRNYEYLVVFDAVGENCKSGFTLLYSDKIFGIGPVKFDYTFKELNSIQQLKDLSKL